MKKQIAKILVFCLVLSLLPMSFLSSSSIARADEYYYDTADDVNVITPRGTSDASRSIEITFTVSNGIATVDEISDAAVAAAADKTNPGDPLLIDLTIKGGTVYGAILTVNSLAKIEAIAKVSGVTIRLTSGDVTFYDEALRAIIAQATGTVKLTLVKGSVAELNSAQQNAVKALDVVAKYTILLTSGNTTISDFRGGVVAISVPFQLRAATSGFDYLTQYVSLEGALEAQRTYFDADVLTFRVRHFSDYVMNYAKYVNPFTDVADDAWYAGDVKYVHHQSLMNGRAATIFAPDANLTRAEVAQVLYNMNGRTGDKAAKFSDVTAEKWYADAVNWAAAYGVVKGITDTTYAPASDVTREQFVTMLYRYCQAKGYVLSTTGDLSVFSDADAIHSWAKDAMQWAVGAGIISGMGDGTCAPQGLATRAQIAKIMRVFDKIATW